MRKILAAIGAIVALGTPLAGFSQDIVGTVVPSVELWRGLYAGMSKSEVKNLFPNDKVMLAENCEFTMNPQYVDKKLVRVLINSRWKAAKNECADDVVFSLEKTYGEPTRSFPQVSYDGYRYTKTQWESDNKIVSVGLYDGTNRVGFISYEVLIGVIRENPEEIEGL